jgi:hypothetical protein
VSHLRGQSSFCTVIAPPNNSKNGGGKVRIMQMQKRPRCMNCGVSARPFETIEGGVLRMACADRHHATSPDD